MVDKSASNPEQDQEEKSGPEVADDGSVPSARKSAQQRESAPINLEGTPQPLTASATPLQRLLDPAQSLLGRSTPLQGRTFSGLALPTWHDLQTYSFAPYSRALDEAEHASTPTQPQPAQPKPEPPPIIHLELDDLPPVSPTPASKPPVALQPTLDESVVEALIQALYEALPADLNEPTWDSIPQTTVSGSLIGRHQTTLSAVPTRLVRHASPRHPVNVTGHATAEAAPKQFSRGLVDEATLRVTRESLTPLELEPPTEDTAHRLEVRAVLGADEACYLRAQSALWAWRTHRQQNLQLHTDGPPGLGRNALIEQRIGPVTLLIGCRVTEMQETERRWGFTMVSLTGQVLRSHETFLVEWQADNEVVFTCTSLQQIAFPSLGFLGPVHSALRRVMIQGYTRNMIEMSANAD